MAWNASHRPPLPFSPQQSSPTYVRYIPNKTVPGLLLSSFLLMGSDIRGPENVENRGGAFFQAVQFSAACDRVSITVNLSDESRAGIQPDETLTYPNYRYHPSLHSCCTVVRSYAKNCSVGNATIDLFATPWSQTVVYGCRLDSSVHSDPQRSNALWFLRKNCQ